MTGKLFVMMVYVTLFVALINIAAMIHIFKVKIEAIKMKEITYAVMTTLFSGFEIALIDFLSNEGVHPSVAFALVVSIPILICGIGQFLSICIENYENRKSKKHDNDYVYNYERRPLPRRRHREFNEEQINDNENDSLAFQEAKDAYDDVYEPEKDEKDSLVTVK